MPAEKLQRLIICGVSQEMERDRTDGTKGRIGSTKVQAVLFGFRIQAEAALKFGIAASPYRQQIAVGESYAIGVIA
jgi:hypothetical protein